MAVKGLSTSPKISEAGASPSDCLMSYIGHSLGEVLPLSRNVVDILNSPTSWQSWGYLCSFGYISKSLFTHTHTHTSILSTAFDDCQFFVYAINQTKPLGEKRRVSKPCRLCFWYSHSVICLHTVKWSKYSIWPVDGTVSGTTTAGLCGPRNISNERVFHISQSSKTGGSPSESLVSYPGHPLVQRWSRLIL